MRTNKNDSNIGNLYVLMMITIIVLLMINPVKSLAQADTNTAERYVRIAAAIGSFDVDTCLKTDRNHNHCVHLNAVMQVIDRQSNYIAGVTETITDMELFTELVLFEESTYENSGIINAVGVIGDLCDELEDAHNEVIRSLEHGPRFNEVAETLLSVLATAQDFSLEECLGSTETHICHRLAYAFTDINHDLHINAQPLDYPNVFYEIRRQDLKVPYVATNLRSPCDEISAEQCLELLQIEDRFNDFIGADVCIEALPFPEQVNMERVLHYPGYGLCFARIYENESGDAIVYFGQGDVWYYGEDTKIAIDGDSYMYEFYTGTRRAVVVLDRTETAVEVLVISQPYDGYDVEVVHQTYEIGGDTAVGINFSPYSIGIWGTEGTVHIKDSSSSIWGMEVTVTHPR